MTTSVLFDFVLFLRGGVEKPRETTMGEGGSKMPQNRPHGLCTIVQKGIVRFWSRGKAPPCGEIH